MRRTVVSLLLAGRYYGVEQHWTRVVRNGGVAIVQYNTPEYDNNFGPYPYVAGRNPEEVTDEASRRSRS